MTPEEKTQKVVEAYYEAGGNVTEAARLINMKRSTFRDHLDAAGIKPLKSGRISMLPDNVRNLPQGKAIKRYLLTAAQNNTPVNERFLTNLEAYAAKFDAEIMISRFTYNKASYSNAKSVKPGKQPIAADVEECWFDQRIERYICDDDTIHGSCRYRLAPDLLWCAEMNILPTASRPLSGLATYGGQASCVFPHVKIALESTATDKKRPAQINYTTGSVTVRNYIAKKAGLKAEFHHVYGAAVVEVNSDGEWWVRQIIADDKGSFYDLPGPGRGCVHVHNGQVDTASPLAAVIGDAHFEEADSELVHAVWGQDRFIDTIEAQTQVLHDIHSFRAQNHHERKFSSRYKKFVRGQDNVVDEVTLVADCMAMAHRDWCAMVVVSSNHDRHGDRWLDEMDYRADIPNAKFFLQAQLARVEAYESGEFNWNFTKWAVSRLLEQDDIRWLDRDESFIVGAGTREVQLGMHGDDGPNGSRGTTNSFANVGARIVKAHDHQAAIRDGVYSVGTIALDAEYAVGPSSWSATHCVVYPNGKRTLVTMDRNGKWRA